MTTTEISMDPAAAEEFAARMIGVLNDASAALMVSVGHQVGLFDVLAAMPPSTSEEIATASGLNERYVREWLAAMTTSGVVIYEPAAASYALPPEHAACLTRAAGPENLSHLMQFIPLLASVEEEVVHCFRYGGGVPYSAYRRFHALMSEDSSAVHEAALIEDILPLVPRAIERLRAGIDVADVGCGSGHAINLMARAFPASRFTGYDFSEEAITTARLEAASLGLGNAHFELLDIAELDVCEAYDLITAFDAIHDQAYPAQVLACVSTALRPDGTFLMGDIAASSHLHENLDLPWATFLYTVSTLHCMTVSLALDGDGLGTAWGSQTALWMLGEAGFGEAEVKGLDGDPFNTYYVATKQPRG